MALQSKSFVVGETKWGGWSNAWTLTLNLTENSTNVTNNTSNISYSLVLKPHNNQGMWRSGPFTISLVLGGVDCSGSVAVIKASAKPARWEEGYPDSQTLLSGTINVPHADSGALNMSIHASAPDTTASSYGFPTLTISDSWALTNIPRAATLVSAPDFNDEANPTITYSNPAGTAVTSLQAYIYATDDSTIYAGPKDISKTGTSATLSLTTAERNTLRAACTGKSLTVWFYVKTTIGSTSYWSSKIAKTMTIVNGEPTISSVSITDTNTTATALTGDANKFIKYISNAKVSYACSGNKSATITDYKITHGGNSYKSKSKTFNAVESGDFTITVTDSRGFTTTQSFSKTMLAYVKPTCYLETTNPTPYETNSTMTLQIKGNYWTGNFGSTSNTLTVKYRVKEGNGSYGSQKTISCTVSGTTYTSSKVTIPVSNYHQSVTIEAVVYDKVFSSGITPVVKTVQATPVFDWSKNEFNFNVPVSINGDVTVNGRVVQLATMSTEEIASANDYVVEQSITGIWSWRKWNSGIAECWGTLAPASVSITGTWGAIYAKDNAIERQTYPIVFTTVPVVSINLHNTSGNCWHYTGTQGSASMSPAIGLASGVAGTVTVGAQITAIGRWK